MQIEGLEHRFLATVGAVTLVGAGLLAFVQDDIKKVLAYSTVSQLGYMAMALGVGAWTAAVFHLFTHAFFKANLFLGSGSVAHAVHSRYEEGHGRHAQIHAEDLCHVRHRLAARSPVSSRSPASGPRTRSWSTPGLGHPRRERLGTGQLHLPLRHGHDRRSPHRRLHDPLRLPDLPRRVPRRPPRRPRRRPC